MGVCFKHLFEMECVPAERTHSAGECLGEVSECVLNVVLELSAGFGSCNVADLFIFSVS